MIQEQVYNEIKSINETFFKANDIKLDGYTNKQVYTALQALNRKNILKKDSLGNFIKPTKFKKQITSKKGVKKQRNETIIPNTVSIHPKFSDIRKWTTKDLKGFNLVEITIEGEGSVAESIPEYQDTNPVRIKEGPVDKIIKLKVRSYLKTERVKLKGDEYNHFIKGILKKFSWFRYSYGVMVLESNTGDIIRLHNIRGVFMVKSVNKVNYLKCNLKDIEIAMSELYHQNCEWKPEKKDKGTICFMDKK